MPNTTPIENVWAEKGNLAYNAIVATADGKYPALDGSLITNIAVSGDMNASTYDPTTVAADAFAMDNMVEGTDTKILTATERTRLAEQALTDVIDKLAWNANDLTFDIDTGTDVVIQVGQELLVKVRNVTGSTILNGSVCRITGASGSRPTIELAQANTYANINGVVGIVTADILNNAVGFATVHGIVRNLNTSAFTVGDELFLSDTVAGGITNVEPTLSIPIGTVVFSNPSTGSIFASVDNQTHLLKFANDPSLIANFSPANWKSQLAISSADISDFDTEVSNNTTVASKADQATTYTVDQVDDLLTYYPLAANTYTKSEVDTNIAANFTTADRTKLDGYNAIAVITEATTARSLALTDIGGYIRLTNAASCTITLPTNATVAWASETEPPTIYFRVAAAGIPTLSNAGVTVNDTLGVVAALAEGSTFALQWVATDVWDII